MFPTQTTALALARVRFLLQRQFPNADVLSPRIGPFVRFLLIDPGRSKVLDLTDCYLAALPHVLNIDELLVSEGVIEALNRATSSQRVIRNSDGLFTVDL